MIDHLKNLFPNLIITSAENNHLLLDEQYEWFITSDENFIGIPKHELNEREETLLKTFLTPYDIRYPTPTEKEKLWKNIIQGVTIDEKIDNYRFVYFSFSKKQIEPILFKEAIEELFSSHVPILWISRSEGIIVEELENHKEEMNYEQIIDILMSDLYVKIHFFIGPFQTNLLNTKSYYETIIQSAKLALKYSKKEVLTYIEAIPFLLIDQTDAEFRKNISQLVFKKLMNDSETLQMIQTFFECNLNISETAKELYMHRNSLQYRLDKFEEITGIDLRNFHEALTVYLSLLAMET